MDVSRRTLLRAAAAGTVVTAGCADGSSTPTESDSAETGPPTETDTPTANPTATQSAATVQVRQHADLGGVLVGPEGMTLYRFDTDMKGMGTSACSGGCADNWPPLTVDGEPSQSDAVTAQLSTFEREDGSRQVAANGWPLYYFTPDGEPGDAMGQGVTDVWWVLRPDGSPVRSNGSPTATETPTGTATGTETPAGTATLTETDRGY